MGLRYRRAVSEIITGFSPDSLLLAAGMSWGTRWIVNVLYKVIWSYWGGITIRSRLHVITPALGVQVRSRLTALLVPHMLIGVLSLTSRRRSARREGNGREWQGIGGWWEVSSFYRGSADCKCNSQWKKVGELVGAGRGTEEGKKWEASTWTGAVGNRHGGRLAWVRHHITHTIPF